jgi:hypothetical protein
MLVDVDDFLAYANFRNLKRDAEEGATAWMDRVRRTAADAFPTAPEREFAITQKFLDAGNLPTAVLTWAAPQMMKGTLTPGALLESALRHEAAQAMKSPKPAEWKRRVCILQARSVASDAEERMEEDAVADVGAPRSVSAIGMSRGGAKCYTCGEQGHLWRDCPVPPPRGSRCGFPPVLAGASHFPPRGRPAVATSFSGGQNFRGGFGWRGRGARFQAPSSLNYSGGRVWTGLVPQHKFGRDTV